MKPIAMALIGLIGGAPAWAAGGAAGGAGGGVPIGPVSNLQMAMTLYVGGITLGKVDMRADFAGGKYRVQSNLQTGGVVNAFWQSEIQATASGRLEGKLFQPQMYDSFTSNHNNRHQEVALTYENGYPGRLYANPPYPVRGYEVKPDEKRGAFDPLSAVVYLLAGPASAPCDATLPVFDGRRRYTVSLSKVKDVDIKMDNGLYKGPGVQCEVVYKQISGYSQKLLKESKIPPIFAWIALIPGEGGRTYRIPLRVWAKTQYGIVAAVATSLKTGAGK